MGRKKSSVQGRADRLQKVCKYVVLIFIIGPRYGLAFAAVEMDK